MLSVQVMDDELIFRGSLRVRFMRTLRITNWDGAHLPLRDFGGLPIFCAADYPESVPAAWHARPSVFVPIHSHEAMAIRFSTADSRPTALKVGIDGINALTGESWDCRLSSDPQDYLVCPEQTCLDGYTIGHGLIRQFTALPKGSKRVMLESMSERESCTDIQLEVFEPRHERSSESCEQFGLTTSPLVPKGSYACAGQAAVLACRQTKPASLDRYGIHTWDPLSYGCVWVYLVSRTAFRHITGQELPASPVPVGRYRDRQLTAVAPHPIGPPSETEEATTKAKYRPWVRHRRGAIHR